MKEMREAGPYVRRFQALLLEYNRQERYEAVDNLFESREMLAEMISGNRLPRLTAPSPYPRLVIADLFWAKAGKYWFSYILDDDGPVVTGAYHQSADIPKLVRLTKSD